MFITLATDWALRRQAQQSKLFVELIASIGFVLLIQKHDDRERIVNRDGKVVSYWRNK